VWHPPALPHEAILKLVSAASSQWNVDFSKAVKDRKAKRRVTALSQMARIPPAAIRIFTDGSANPNPGPAGAGAYIVFPSGREVRLFCPLGHGTNNDGEIWAIAMACSFLSTSNTPKDSKIYFLPDSQLAIDLFRNKARPKTNAEFVRAAKSHVRLWLQNAVFIPLPSHTGIPENDIADALADRGTNLSTAGAPRAPRFSFQIAL
jgi:ribonuclease HI